jgi:ABC-2 type transport system permease protein
LLATAVLLIVAMAPLAIAAAGPSACSGPAACPATVTGLSFTGVLIGQVAVVVLATLLVGDEYATGLIRLTLTAVPSRLAVFLGKLIVASALALLAGSAGVAGALVAADALGFPPPSAAAAAGTTVYLPLVAILSAGVTAALRDTAAGLLVVLAALFVTPVLARVIGDPAWQRRLEDYSPMTAGLAARYGDLWPGLGVLAGYAAAAALAGGLVLLLRDP